MKRITGLLLALLFPLLTAAADIGEWKHLLAYHNAQFCLPAGNEVYAVYDGNLLAYHPADGEVRLLSGLDGLSGKDIRFMGYSESEKCLVLVYANLLIDLLYPADGSVVSLPQISNSVTDGATANALFTDGENAMLSMSDGLVHLQLKRQEISGYYRIGQNVRAAAWSNGNLLAATDTQLYLCPANGNPLDQSEWKPVRKAAFSQFAACGGHLYAVTASQPTADSTPTGLWLLNADGTQAQSVSSAVFTHLAVQQKKLMAANSGQILLFDAAQPATPEKTYNYPNSWASVSYASDGTLWASEGDKGLQAYQASGTTLRPKGSAVGNYGPRRDLCYFMRFEGNRLLIAGGRLDPYDKQHYDGTLMALENGKWTFFQEDGIAEQTGVPYRDITSVAQDPEDPNHHYASAGGTGLYEFRDFRFVRQLSNHNSPLESSTSSNSPRYVRIDGVNFDAGGNLWMVNNSQRDTVLRVLRPNGTWKGFYIESIRRAPTCEKTLFDRKGRLWMASRRTTDNPQHESGLLGFDFNGTLDDTGDDDAYYRSSFTNQDGKSYELGGVYALAEDRDGSIWVGTRSGLFIISQPDQWWEQGFYVTQIKVPRNDGTNLADYLLDGLPVTAIAIDGGGQKWIGTESNGLYLVSADGLQVLQHFTTENSPLLSDYIYSIAPHPTTGEVMIGTDQGLCSYQGQATEPATALRESNIKVYPNPVRPEYQGNVRVTGLTDNADVKVTSTNGDVVAGGRSVGGTFVWNVRDRSGGRAAPGIYYIMVSTSDGKKGVAAKVAVI